MTTTEIASAEEQLKIFGTFLEKNDKILNSYLDRNAISNNQQLPKTINDDIIRVNYTFNREKLTLLRLLESDRILNKTLLTFAHFCAEIQTILNEAEILQSKFLNIDSNLLAHTIKVSKDTENNIKTSDGDVKNLGSLLSGSLLLEISESVEFLYQIHFLIQRCSVLGNNLLHQCGSFCGTDGITFELKFLDVFDHLASLLYNIIIFDEILAGSTFSSLFSLYKTMIDGLVQRSTCSIKAASFCTQSEYKSLQICINELQFLFSGTIFRQFLNSTFVLKDKIGSKGMGQLIILFNEYIKYKISYIERILEPEWKDLNDPKSLIALNVFTVLFHDFCGQIDPKNVKNLLELNAKQQGIILIDTIIWHSTVFLHKNAETLIKPHMKYVQSYQRNQKHFLQLRVKNLQRDCRQFCLQITNWTLELCKALKIGTNHLKIDQFKKLITLFLLGLKYADQISYSVRILLSIHLNEDKIMSKQTLLSICKLIELLKILQLTYKEERETISKIIYCIVPYLQYKVLYLLNGWKKKLNSSTLQGRNVDILAALKLAEKFMNGPTTKLRILLTKLAVDAANSNNKALLAEQYEQFSILLQRIETLSNFQQQLEQICDTTFLQSHQIIFSKYIQQFVEKKIDINSFQFLMIAYNENSNKKLIADQKFYEQLKFVQNFKENYFQHVRSDLLNNLCTKIETYLRLEVHSDLQFEHMKPFEDGIEDYQQFINAAPIKINTGNYIVLKHGVENFLSALFYNLTTINLHDWKTYEQMRHYANVRLLFNPIENYLPNQTLEQGIDILEIMRNINIFVSKYAYNMNSQIFIEQESNNKILDTISIKHVANSFRTHGSGVVNTTVNFTYQFLRQKFYTFSQFLYDEQIKARLMKELRSHADRKQQNYDTLYTYERAEIFNKDIRKLGLFDNQSYMDLFRKVITHIGNAMGYIRLVRAGSIHANYSASLFLPKFDENLNFVDMCKEQECDEVTVEAADLFELNINHLATSFSDSTDYFHLLVEAFQPFFGNPQNLHLKTFFLIVPPLMVNHIEYMLRVKDKIGKKDRQNAVLFDDGFAVGLVYIIILLRQFTDLNSLQWFEAISEHFNTERQKIKKMLLKLTTKSNATNLTETQKNEYEKLQQTLALTERRIRLYQAEYSLLYYNFCSAKIFFQ